LNKNIKKSGASEQVSAIDILNEFNRIIEEQYAKNLKDAFLKLGYEISVKTYGFERKLPTVLSLGFNVSKSVSKLA